MELYTLDALLRRQEVVDTFDSLIWTERFAEFGDFELRVRSSRAFRSLFEEGMFVTTDTTDRVMQIETILDGTDDEGHRQLVVKGPSIEKIMDDRMARNTLDDTTTAPKWTLTGTPGDIARQIFDDICRNAIVDIKDQIPLLQAGTTYPSGTIEEPTDVITIDVEPQSVYEAIKSICDLYDLGFRMYRNYDTSQLYFDVYTGSDRTTLQQGLPPVIFAPQLDNLTNTSELKSIDGYKNVAIVLSPVGSETVYSALSDTTVSGFDRRVLTIRADDITDTDPAVASALMIQRGKEELSKHRKFMVFDGEVSQFSTYKYGTDYRLGDLVEMQNDDGAINYMRVTEQIQVSDSEGERSYPTLTVYFTITPGSWAAWDPSEVWQDMGLTDYWSTV